MNNLNPAWPVLKHYDQNHLARIALPLGGIGTGTVSLGGRGQLTDWEVYSHPDKGFVPQHSFFALWAKPAGGPAVARALEGAIEPWLYEGASGCTVPNHGLPRFRKCSFHAAYPLAQVCFSDPDVPVDARIEAFNPLVPADADASGIPVAVLRFVLTNKTDQAVAASVCGSLQNFVGNDGAAATGQRQPEPLPAVGQTQRAAHAARRGRPARRAVRHAGAGGAGDRGRHAPHDVDQHRLEHIAARLLGRLQRRRQAGGSRGAGRRLQVLAANSDAPIGSLAVSVKLPPRGTKAVTFLLAWHFPNRQTWTPAKPGDPACESNPDCNRVGNYYATRYRDAWDAVAHTARRNCRRWKHRRSSSCARSASATCPKPSKRRPCST